MRSVMLAALLALPATAQAPTRAAAAVPVRTAPPARPEPSEALWALLDAHAPVKDGEAHGVIERRRVETRSDIEALICRYSWNCPQALRVANCESTFRPWVTSPGGHIGVFQLAPNHARRIGVTPADLYDAATNVRAAHALWSSAGWQPWSCRP